MYKFILFSLISFLVACGSDSSDQFDPTQLEQFKGRASAPDISEVAVVDGDTIYLNQRSYGEVFEGLDVQLQFIAPKSGRALILIAGSTANFESIPSMNVSPLYLSISGGYRSAFSMDHGESYKITFSAIEGESSGAFEFELVEANRESLGLANNEYLVDLEFVGERYFEGGGEDQCDIYAQPADPSIKYSENYSYQVILNYVLKYQRQVSINSGKDYGEKSGNTLQFDKGNSFYDWEETFKINSSAGLISGSYYKKQEEPDIIGELSGLLACPRLPLYRISNGVITGGIIL
mgnify:CR=1 FL=1